MRRLLEVESKQRGTGTMETKERKGSDKIQVWTGDTQDTHYRKRRSVKLNFYIRPYLPRKIQENQFYIQIKMETYYSHIAY